tara:strand:+ start:367 stop:480 length:114 start_codon:yes stop_codon:yes gene_type:complete
MQAMTKINLYFESLLYNFEIIRKIIKTKENKTAKSIG